MLWLSLLCLWLCLTLSLYHLLLLCCWDIIIEWFFSRGLPSIWKLWLMAGTYFFFWWWFLPIVILLVIVVGIILGWIWLSFIQLLLVARLIRVLWWWVVFWCWFIWLMNFCILRDVFLVNLLLILFSLAFYILFLRGHLFIRLLSLRSFFTDWCTLSLILLLILWYILLLAFILLFFNFI